MYICSYFPMKSLAELYNFYILTLTFNSTYNQTLCKLFLCNLRSLFLLHILVIQFQVSQNYNQVINVEMNRCCIKHSDGQI